MGIYVLGGGLICAKCTWRSKDKVEKLILSLYHVGPGYQSKVTRVGSKCLYLPSYLDGQHTTIFHVLCGCGNI